jgi:hypothetical protein
MTLTMRTARRYEYQSPGTLFPFPHCYTPLEGTGSYKEGPDEIYGCYRHYTKARPLTARILEHVYKKAMRDLPLAPVRSGRVWWEKRKPEVPE